MRKPSGVIFLIALTLLNCSTESAVDKRQASITISEAQKISLLEDASMKCRELDSPSFTIKYWYTDSGEFKSEIKCTSGFRDGPDILPDRAPRYTQ